MNGNEYFFCFTQFTRTTSTQQNTTHIKWTSRILDFFSSTIVRSPFGFSYTLQCELNWKLVVGINDQRSVKWKITHNSQHQIIYIVIHSYIQMLCREFVNNWWGTHYIANKLNCIASATRKLFHIRVSRFKNYMNNRYLDEIDENHKKILIFFCSVFILVFFSAWQQWLFWSDILLDDTEWWCCSHVSFTLESNIRKYQQQQQQKKQLMKLCWYHTSPQSKSIIHTRKSSTSNQNHPICHTIEWIIWY